MYVHACSNSVTVDVITYCGMKQSTVKTQELMDIVNINRGNVYCFVEKLPEQYFIQPMDYCAVLILPFYIYVICFTNFVSRLSHGLPLMIF